MLWYILLAYLAGLLTLPILFVGIVAVGVLAPYWGAVVPPTTQPEV